MSDQISNFLPWVSFLAGVGGSLHCVGMCGGLAASSCDKPQDVVRYQFGRLLGYLLLAGLAGYLGSFLNIKSLHPYAAVVPGFIIGGLFVFWGIQNFRGRKAELPMPKFFGKFYTRLWMKLVFKNKNFTKAFFTGFISIMLPCGLLYGIVLSTAAMENVGMALVSMFFFWLGTVPSMVAAPGILQKIIRPIKNKLPKTYAITLVSIGLLTISFRISKLHEIQKQERLSGEITHKSCH